MMDQPSIRELVEAVREFLETRAMPELKGHTAFHARVAANALGIVARQLQSGAAADDEEKKRLATLLGHEGTLEELNRELCKRIRDGAIGFANIGSCRTSGKNHARQTRDRPAELFRSQAD